MSSFNAYPPVRHHSSQRISPSKAQEFLAAFLEATTIDSSLHPNALLTEDGPMNASSGSTGLVLHNLKRVEAGLRGEHLAADLTFKDFGGEGLPSLMSNGIPIAGAENDRSNGEAGQDALLDWQDKEEYEREQAIEHGDLGSRNTAIADLGPDKPSNKVGEVPAVHQAEGANKVDKLDRKRKKKEKRDQKKREAEAQRQRRRESH
ncbi:MAG: hypothetical protein Q9200_000823 [Gallowayella weberi]